MPFPHRSPTHFPRSVNQYVPAMTGAADVGRDFNYFVDFGTPAVELAAGILSAAAAGTYELGSFLTTAGFNGVTGELDARYGRGLSIVGTVAGSNAVTLYGYDYLGQPIKKTSAINGTTPVNFNVAFKWLTKVEVGAGTAALNLGYSKNLGLPYVTGKMLDEYVDGVRGNPGALTGATFTDPATATTMDPRSLYVAATTLDGVKHVIAQAQAVPFVNNNGNGGLYGIRHYFG